MTFHSKRWWLNSKLPHPRLQRLVQGFCSYVAHWTNIKTVTGYGLIFTHTLQASEAYMGSRFLFLQHEKDKLHSSSSLSHFAGSLVQDVSSNV